MHWTIQYKLVKLYFSDLLGVTVLQWLSNHGYLDLQIPDVNLKPKKEI